MSGYIGINNKAKGISDIYVGVDGKAQKVVAGFVGDENGKAKQIYSSEPPIWKFSVKTGAYFAMQGECEIDFGDGNTQTLTDRTHVEIIQHYYGDLNIHQVTVTGRIAWVGFKGADHPEYLQSIDTVIPKRNWITQFNSCFQGCTSLTSIPSGLFDNCTAVVSFDYCFEDCTSLTSIPSGLFDNCTAVTSFSKCFDNCISLTSIPSGLFDNCTAVTSFVSCFRKCTSLTAIPSGLFDNCTAVTSFNSSFYNCTALTGLAPELWDTTVWTDVTSHSLCFFNCTNLSNYGDIPNDWK